MKLPRRAVLGLPLALALPSAAQDALDGAAVRPGAVIRLPRDFGSHPAQAIEWWYVTGTLAAGRTDPSGIGSAEPSGFGSAEAFGFGSAEAKGLAGGDPFGFQVTFFRSRTDVATGHPSRFAATQLLFAHAAVTDPVQRKLRHDQRIARAGFGIAEASIADTDVRLRDWHLRRESGPPGIGQRYTSVVDAPAAGFGFELTFTATQPVLLQGEAGYSRKGPQPGQASLYLSEPQLAVAGTLRIDGRSAPVTGRAWLDHEWSDTLLDPQAVGWDWIGMNLDDGSALTAFQLRRADGTALWTGGSFRSSPPSGGSVQNFADGSLRFEPLRHWASPATRARYPVAWRIETPAGRFEVHSRLDAQELDGSRSTGSVYWEGLSDLLDARGQRIGRGYLEMTGYAGRLQL